MDIKLLPCPSYCKQYCYEHWGPWILFELRIFFWSGIAGSYGSSIYLYKEPAYSFPLVAAPISILSNSVAGFHFLYTLTSIYCL